MLRRVRLGLALLRLTAVGALALLVWNPVAPHREAASAPPLVLLDASLSMAGHGGQWRRALDTARALARGGVIWRFGAEVRPFDTLPPTDGASRLAPALTAGATRGGPVIVVTDGAIGDVAELAPDLLRRPRIVVLPRAPFFDAFVAAVEGPRHVGASDTVRLGVTYGSRGAAPGGPHRVRLAVRLGDHLLAERAVTLPVDGTLATELAFPAARLPPGWSALEVRLEGAADAEPRDDARTFVLEALLRPAVVLLAAPPDWETRFLARTLAEVTRQPVRAFVDLAAPAGEPRWRDAATLAAVTPAELNRALAAAALVIEAGEPTAFARLTPRGAVWRWPVGPRRDGDWYVQPPPPSPLAAALAAVAWDSLPPATSWIEIAPDTATWATALTARLARRGPAHPLVVLSKAGGARRAIVVAGGLYRWAFRGGASGEAYRSLVAALSDWLLGGGGGVDRFAPITYEVANGMPLRWRWTGAPPAGDIALTLTHARASVVDTLHFDAQGAAELGLAPGPYRYAAADGRERGVVAVDRYSDEWLPSAAALAPQPGAPADWLASLALRDRWWPFVLVLAASALEWAWRRREGLP